MGTAHRVGVLLGARPNHLNPLLEVFRQGLRDLGHAEPQIVFHIRDAGGRVEDLPRLAGELISLKVDVIVTASSTPATLAAKLATARIPIVAVAGGAPVLTGLVRRRADCALIEALYREAPNQTFQPPDSPDRPRKRVFGRSPSVERRGPGEREQGRPWESSDRAYGAGGGPALPTGF